MTHYQSVVRAFLFNPEGQILMVRHKPGKPWVLPGGHVESSENLHDAMIREIREELDIDADFFDIDDEERLTHHAGYIRNLPLPISIYDLEYRDAHGHDQSRREYIFLMETHDTIMHTQTEEIAEYQWFDPDEILEMRPNIDTWDFYREMLEKIIGEDLLDE